MTKSDDLRREALQLLRERPRYQQDVKLHAQSSIGSVAGCRLALTQRVPREAAERACLLALYEIEAEANVSQPLAVATTGGSRMVPDRIENYRGHEIRIFVLRPIGDATTFRAIYEVQVNGSEHVVAGAIAGAFSTARAVEEGALEAGKFSIDEKGRSV